MRLAARIAELELTGYRVGGGVLQMLPGETTVEAIARAMSNQMTGGVLLVPAPMSAEAWEWTARFQQGLHLSQALVGSVSL